MTAQTICVTAEHIANGIAEECDECPVALAIIQAWGTGTGVAVSENEIWLWPVNSGHLIAPVPTEARAFITAFDIGAPVEPFTFTVEWAS